MTGEEKARRKDIKDTLINSFDAVLKPVGFVRKGNTWYRETADHVHTIYLYRFQNSFGYRVHIGVQEKASDHLKEDRLKRYKDHLERPRTLRTFITSKSDIPIAVSMLEEDALTYFESQEVSVLTEAAREKVRKAAEPTPPPTADEKKERKRLHGKLLRTMDKTLKSAGFTRKKLTWRRDFGDFTHVINLIKMQEGWKYVIATGVFIKALNPEMVEPDLGKCHYQKRFEEIAPDRGRDLNFEDPSKSPDEKLTGIQEGLQDEVLPYLAGFESVDALDAESFPEDSRMRRLLNELRAK